MNLKVQKIDAYQFVGKDFTLVITLPDSFPDISRRTSNLPLKVDVCYEDEINSFDTLDRNFNPNLLEVKANTNIDRSRRAVVTVRINEPSANHNNRKFILRFIAFTLEGDLTSVVGYSIPITIVRYRLKIQEEFSERGSYIWMKDVGGKDKSIDLQVSLVDTEDRPITTMRVPLRVALLYSNGAIVPQQDILQLSPETQLLIGASGTTRIKCRINEVSSRHQGQLFQVLVAPDFHGPSPLADISPARSVPVEVKSKINISHKRKLQALSEAGTAAGAGAEGTESAALGGETPKFDPARNRRAPSLPFSTTALTNSSASAAPYSAGLTGALGASAISMAAAAEFASLLPMSSVLSSGSYMDTVGNTAGNNGGAAVGASNGKTGTGSSWAGNASAGAAGSFAALNPAVLAAMSVATAPLTATHSFGAAAHTSGGSLSRQGSTGNMSGALLLRPPSIDVNAPPHPLASSTPLSSVTPVAPGLGDYLAPAAVARAIREVTSFAEAANAALAALQWTPIGQMPAVHPETGLPLPGSATDRVLYNMPNPNMVIAALSDRYQQLVQPQLAVLERALTPSNTRSAGGHSNSNSSSTASRTAPAAPPAGPPALAAARLPSVSLDPSEHHGGGAGAVQNSNPSTPLNGAEERSVYMERCVVAVQTLPNGDKTEHELGVPAFTMQGGKPQLAGFYNMDAAGKISFKDCRELLHLLEPAAGSTRSQASNSNNNSTSSSGSSLDSSGSSAGTGDGVVGDGSATTPPKRAVAALLQHIGAQEVKAFVPLERDKKTHNFDPAVLYSRWRKWGAADKLRVPIN